MMKNGCMHAPIRELGTLFNEGAVGMLSDGQLLDRFVERRDASAFEAIVERYGPLVWGVCRRVLRDHHDAEDAFQATFLVLARKAASVMPREKLGNWLYGVAFQTAMNAKTTRAKRRVRERPAWEMTEPEAVPDEQADEWLSRLDREVARLPEKYRMPIILCELEGKTHRQAAEQLGWPVGTVSGRLSRARAMLASRLSRPGTPLTVGALGVLLVHDAAQAGVPPELVRSTAQAASLSTAGKAVTAGVVSAEVAALTGEVLKTMLINKLTLATAMLLVALALAAGGTSLTYRAHATEPANPKKAPRIPRSDRIRPRSRRPRNRRRPPGPLPDRRRNRLAYRLPAGSSTSKAGRSPGSRCKSPRSTSPRVRTWTPGSRRPGRARNAGSPTNIWTANLRQRARTSHHRQSPTPRAASDSTALKPSGSSTWRSKVATIAYTRMNVVTRRMESVAAPGFASQYGPGSQTIHGSDFIYTASLGRPVEGIVRDAKTKQPLANVEIRSDHFAGTNWAGHPGSQDHHGCPGPIPVGRVCPRARATA